MEPQWVTSPLAPLTTAEEGLARPDPDGESESAGSPSSRGSRHYFSFEEVDDKDPQVSGPAPSPGQPDRSHLARIPSFLAI
jgi:hypothetical protein